MNDPRAFARFCNIVSVVLCTGCVLAFAFSFRGGEANMMGFPILFLLAALLQFFSAWQNFRRDIRGRNRKGAGIGGVLSGVVMLALCYVMILCLW